MISLKQINNFLDNKYSSEIEELTKLLEGMFSQAYSFKLGEAELVLRLNTNVIDFKKGTTSSGFLYFYTYPCCTRILVSRGYCHFGMTLV